MKRGFPLSAGRLAGQSCMITGATACRNIGHAIAQRFLEEDASSITLIGRSQERLDLTARSLRPSSKVKTFLADISEPGSWIRDLEKEMVKENTDILVNAAGVANSNILAKYDPDDISKILRTNLEGAILTSRAFTRAMLRLKPRRYNPIEAQENEFATKCIINISSLLAFKGGEGSVPYAASKAGILGLTRSLVAEASEMRLFESGPRLRCNAIVPGYIHTPMIQFFSPERERALEGSIPLRRFGAPHEVADAAVFLAANGYANNCVLNLDGGLSAV